jgi:hypothetical protein
MNTTASALALRAVLGPIMLEPILRQDEGIVNMRLLRPAYGQTRNNVEETPFKPYYLAHTKIQTLALLDERHKGTNWCEWRRR